MKLQDTIDIYRKLKGFKNDTIYHKLNEEVNELGQAILFNNFDEVLEEIADVNIVINAIATFYGIDLEEATLLKMNKDLRRENHV